MFTWRRNRKPVDDRHGQLIRVLAERTAAELCEQFETRQPTDVAELRGYARARAGTSVRRQLRLAIAENDANAALPAEIVTLASERAVHLIIREQMLRSQLPVVRRAA